jgi:hypothetical protein
LVRMFLRVCGPSASASQVSYSAVSLSLSPIFLRTLPPVP